MTATVALTLEGQAVDQRAGQLGEDRQRPAER